MPIIAFTGKAGSGKDTSALALNDFVFLAFASPLKNSAKILFDTDHLNKEAIIDGIGVSSREIYQSLGDFARSIHQDIFIVMMKKRVEELWSQGIENICITDVRYDNEAKLVKELGGAIVEIKRPSKPTNTQHSSHSSEQGVKIIDCIIVNDGTIEELQRKVVDVLYESIL